MPRESTVLTRLLKSYVFALNRPSYLLEYRKQIFKNGSLYEIVE